MKTFSNLLILCVAIGLLGVLAARIITNINFGMKCIYAGLFMFLLANIIRWLVTNRRGDNNG